jgi:hypothetical protein
MKQFPPVIVATSVVPWTEDYELDEPRFRHNVRTQLARLTKHIYIFGTAGEGYAVSDRQFAAIAAVFRDEMQRGGGHPMLGVVSLSLSTIIERIERGRALGFRQFQISFPSWGALADREVDIFFRETCGRFGDCRFLHYNLMRTKRVLGADDYARISPRHPNLVAVKMGGGSDRAKLVELVTKAPDVQFCFGADAYARIRDEHECAHLISIAATNLAKARAFTDARGERLRAMAAELEEVHRAILGAVGDAGHVDGVYDKLLWKLHDPSFPLRLLPPYTTCDDGALERFRAAIPAAWLPSAEA